MKKKSNRFFLRILPLSELGRLDMQQVFGAERLAIRVPKWGEMCLMEYLDATGLGEWLEYKAVCGYGRDKMYIFDVPEYPKYAAHPKIISIRRAWEASQEDDDGCS